MNPSEAVGFDDKKFQALRKLVNTGEGPSLEFKRKAAHPEKIVREIVAFANTKGGTLLIGVDDDRSIPGVKYPEEETLAIQEALDQYCRPAITLTDSIIRISESRFVVRMDIELNDRRPHFVRLPGAPAEGYVRAGDMSVKASREMLEIVRRSKKSKDIRFNFGDAEKSLMEYLDVKGSVSLDEFRSLAKLSRFAATRKLILLVLANVLRIVPSDKGDLYFRVG